MHACKILMETCKLANLKYICKLANYFRVKIQARKLINKSKLANPIKIASSQINENCMLANQLRGNACSQTNSKMQTRKPIQRKYMRANEDMEDTCPQMRAGDVHACTSP